MTPGDVVELVEGMEELYIMGTVNGFQKVTKIDGLQNMGSSLTVGGGRGGLFVYFHFSVLFILVGGRCFGPPFYE